MTALGSSPGRGGDRLYLLDGGGRLWLSRDRGEGWEERGRIGGRPAAFLATSSEMLFAATHEGEIKRSSDGGVSWTTRPASTRAASAPLCRARTLKPIHEVD
jgi:hypothetical protein